jgi:hypothetical protein
VRERDREIKIFPQAIDGSSKRCMHRSNVLNQLQSVLILGRQKIEKNMKKAILKDGEGDGET